MGLQLFYKGVRIAHTVWDKIPSRFCSKRRGVYVRHIGKRWIWTDLVDVFPIGGGIARPVADKKQKVGNSSEGGCSISGLQYTAPSLPSFLSSFATRVHGPLSQRNGRDFGPETFSEDRRVSSSDRLPKQSWQTRLVEWQTAPKTSIWLIPNCVAE